MQAASALSSDQLDIAKTHRVLTGHQERKAKSSWLRWRLSTQVSQRRYARHCHFPEGGWALQRRRASSLADAERRG
jgi:hypothetical protein